MRQREITRLQTEITDVLTVQREAQATLSRAEAAQVDALILEQQAHDAFSRARSEALDAEALIRACVERIGDLQDRIPRQREPE
jgi:hypothetical protein